MINVTTSIDMMPDGTVRDPALNVRQGMSGGSGNEMASRYQSSAVRIVRVDKVHYTDDELNSTNEKENKRLEYTCSFVGGAHARERIYRVVDARSGGGKHIVDFQVRQPPDEKDTSGQTPGSQEKKPEETSGDFALAVCIDQFSNSWALVQDYPHPQANHEAERGDGVQKVKSFNGVRETIDKDGKYTLRQTGGTEDVQTGKPQFEDEAGGTENGTAFSFTPQGKMSITDKNESTFEMDPSSKSMSTKSAGDLTREALANTTEDLKGVVNQKISGAFSTDIKGLATFKSPFSIHNGGGTQVSRLGDKIIDSRGGMGTIVRGSNKANFG